MIKVRNDYETIFNEIEGEDSDLRIVWPIENPTICYPKFMSKKDYLLKQSVLTKGSVMKFVPNGSNSDNENLNHLELENLKRLSKTDLISLRESVSLEMLWIQQAIQSRIQVN